MSPVLGLVLPQVSHMGGAAELDGGVGGALGVPGGQHCVLEVLCREVIVSVGIEKQLRDCGIQLIVILAPMT